LLRRLVRRDRDAPLSSQQPYSLPSSHRRRDGYEYCDSPSVLSSGAIAGIAIGGSNNTPPILIDALVLTPGLRPPQISSHFPHRHRPCRVGLSQASAHCGPCPDKCHLPPNNSSCLLPAGSTGYWHGVWEPIWWGPTAVHTPVPAPGAKRRFPAWVRPQRGLCSGTITTVISSLPPLTNTFDTRCRRVLVHHLSTTPTRSRHSRPGMDELYFFLDFYFSAPRGAAPHVTLLDNSGTVNTCWCVTCSNCHGYLQ